MVSRYGVPILRVISVGHILELPMMINYNRSTDDPL